MIDLLVLVFILSVFVWAVAELVRAIGERLARNQPPAPAGPRAQDYGAATLGDERAWRLDNGLSHDAHWQSDLEQEGLPLPPWARASADRIGVYGPNSGAMGSDYGPPAVPVLYYGAADVERRSVTDTDTAWLDPVAAYGLLAHRLAAEPDLHGEAPTDPAAFDAWLSGLVQSWMRQQDKSARDYTAGLD